MSDKKIDLPNVTISCVNCVEPHLGVKALRYSMQKINFYEAILFSDTKPTNLTPDIKFVKIKKLDHDYSSLFTLKGLFYAVKTDYSLSIHDDGFIINPHLWDPDFLNYDYIGAPWPDIYTHRVGNGGFCLKSKKLIELCQQIPWHPGDHDDNLVCLRYRDFLEKNGCKFAPLEVAYKFSLESKIPECKYDLNNCFGFHGKGIVESVFQGEGQQFKDKIKLLDTIVDP